MSVRSPNSDDQHGEIRRVIVLGSTGSIGVQTLEAIAHLNTLYNEGKATQRFQIVGLSAGSNHEKLIEQAQSHCVKDIAIETLVDNTIDQSNINLRLGPIASRRLVEEVECDLVVGAIVGIAGLDSLLRAIELGIDVALANKETLVAAGSLVIEAARKSGARILPVDSEHAGVWQCLQSLSSQHYCPPMQAPASIERVVLTASGGPFRTKTRQDIADAKLEDALNHPNWSMGAKVTIDSATLMNKALELIEAHWLFGLSADQLSAVIHPQSIIHAFVERTDSSVIAQLGAPDMRCPIQHALTSPIHSTGCATKLDVTKLGSLEFIEIDPDRFPAINLAMNAIQLGGSAGAILNAANEQAVCAFMNNQLQFGMIDQLVSRVLSESPCSQINSLDDVYAADETARRRMDELCNQTAGHSS